MPAGANLRRWRPVILPAGLVVVAAWLAMLHELSWRAAFDSDHANTALAGQALIGDPLLRGWVLPGDPFWLTYLPLFAVVAAVFGTGPTTLHLVPVVATAGVLASAWWLLGQGTRGPGRWLGFALVVLLIGLPHPVLAQFLLTNMHVGTAVECLIGAGLLVASPRRARWWVGVALLGAAVISDPFGATIGVLPVVCAGVSGALRLRCWAPLLSATAAAVLAGAAAPVARLGLRALGGFGLAPALPLAPASYWPDNFVAIPEMLGSLFGVGPSGGLSGIASAARTVGAALFAFGFVVAGVRLLVAMVRGPGVAPASVSSPDAASRGRRAEASWMDDVLLAGFCGGLATFVVATLPPRDVNSTRYLTTAVIYGAVLAGRQLAWIAALPAAHRVRRTRVATGAALATLALGFLAAPLATLEEPEATNPGRDLVPWLTANGLDAGYGPYWLASIVTVESSGAIPVRPVTAIDGRLRGYVYFSTRRWFEGSSQARRWFVVFDPKLPAWGVDEQTATATFGPPSTTLQHGVYRFLVWDHDLSPHLGPPYRDPEQAVAVATAAADR